MVRSQKKSLVNGGCGKLHCCEPHSQENETLLIQSFASPSQRKRYHEMLLEIFHFKHMLLSWTLLSLPPTQSNEEYILQQTHFSDPVERNSVTDAILAIKIL